MPRIRYFRGYRSSCASLEAGLDMHMIHQDTWGDGKTISMAQHKRARLHPQSWSPVETRLASRSKRDDEVSKSVDCYIYETMLAIIFKWRATNPRAVPTEYWSVRWGAHHLLPEKDKPHTNRHRSNTTTGNKTKTEKINIP